MFTFLIRLMINICLFLVVELPLQLLGISILLPICYFYNLGQFPKIVRWFDIADFYTTRDTSSAQLVNTQGILAKFVYCAFRNPINYFGYFIEGLKFAPPIRILLDSTYNASGIDVGTSSNNTGGLFHTEIIIDEKKYYEYYFIYPYKLLKGNCFRYRMGWKIDHPMSNTPYSTIQKVFTINPFATFSGISS